jgi:CheY-like chemotaxis protein
MSEESMPHVLVVEDEPLIAMPVEDWLGELKCQTVGPATAQQALALIAAEPIDGAILDVSLDRHDSFAVAAALRERAIPLTPTGDLSRRNLPHPLPGWNH